MVASLPLMVEPSADATVFLGCIAAEVMMRVRSWLLLVPC